MNRILAIFFALALTACAAIPNPFTKPTLATVENSYGAALALAVGYRDACAARQIPPSCRPIVVTLQTYGRRAQIAVLEARAFVKNNPAIDATVVLATATTAIEDFEAAETANGVN